jgi:hypothetical protein
MAVPQSSPHTRCLAIAIVAVTMLGGCRGERPPTEAERLARGRETVERMSAKLGSAHTFSVTTSETRDQVMSTGNVQQVKLTRQTVLRRPDRLYFQTSGAIENEGWYDGVGLTLVIHKEKVFGQARMPETLDRALDSMNERYGIPMPLADFLYSNAAKALLADTTTGGWLARDQIDGKAADHLSFKDTGVNWEIWIAATGDPLPLRLVASFPDNKRLRKVDATFTNWNFAPEIAADRFDPNVPKDYEGIAVIQRAAITRNMSDEGRTPVPGVKKP